MSDWVNPAEAMAYFGITSIEELEDIIVEFDVDTLLSEDGRLLGIKGEFELKEALFERHKRKVGHRPDDEAAHEAAVALHHQVQAELKAQRKERRKEHVEKRVKARRAREARRAGQLARSSGS